MYLKDPKFHVLFTYFITWTVPAWTVLWDLGRSKAMGRWPVFKKDNSVSSVPGKITEKFILGVIAVTSLSQSISVLYSWQDVGEWIHLPWCGDSGLCRHETMRAQDSTGHPEHIKLCCFPTEERDKDTLCIVGPGTQQHWGKSFTNLYLDQEGASDGPSAELRWCVLHWLKNWLGWLAHRWLIRWQGRTTAVFQSHLWCHWWLTGWFSKNEHLAFCSVWPPYIIVPFSKAWTWSNRDNLLMQVTQSICLHRYSVHDPHLFSTSSQLEDNITCRTSQHWEQQ